ncbi:hypothetical protein D088_790034 [Salmonella enterica subsp. houtenae serovar 16:z4,z32:-- str. RKS3027]|nr:hypothetical protein D088_790034 [Salmonella enterica subsp. houtenae serovar 16:z4,z32:-- str. RKS3027]
MISIPIPIGVVVSDVAVRQHDGIALNTCIYHQGIEGKSS